MNNTEQDKIKRFLNDEVMEVAVRKSITKSFLKKPKSNDVHYLAGSRIAIDLLDEAWKDLGVLRDQLDQEPQNKKNIAL